MTNTTNAVTGYTDRILASDTPLLGFLVWYSVTEATEISHPDLVTALTDCGLDDFTPKRPTDKNIFKRSVTKQARKKVETDDPDIYENYLMRPVTESTGTVTRHIVVEQVDANNKRLDLAPVVSIEWEAPDQITRAFLPVTKSGTKLHQHDQAMAVAELIEQDFNRDRNIVNAYGIRELIRRVVLSTNAISVKESGGVYFVFASKADTIEKLMVFADNFPGVGLSPVPLVDDTRQREMLRAAYEAETIGEIDKVLTEFDKIDGEIPYKQFERISADLAAMKAKTTDYSTLLEDTLHGVDLKIKVYEARVRKFFLDGKVGD